MDIRKLWIDFFVEKKHKYLEPKSLVPHNDPSLLWINSGVATLKKYFDGSETPPSKRIVNVQRSIRTNDIENVGVTARHHTIFEMLGNFSIGDYFKKESIEWAWEFLTSEKWLGLDKDKLYVTVYEEDQEAFDIWKNSIKLDESKIIKGDKDLNFWDIGQGPCGPNTEIFYDRGQKYDKDNVGVKLLAEDIENDRYIEIWNIVFSQFNNDGSGNYTDLPVKNIDTGMGFERMVAVAEDAVTNFDTSLFLPIINEIEKHTDSKYIVNAMPNTKEYESNIGFKVISDHFKANIFAINDGAEPNNKDRGYVLRMLLRRAFYYIKKMNIKGEAIKNICDSIVKNYNEFYPELNDSISLSLKIIQDEFARYEEAISKGKKHFDKFISTNKTLTTKDVFTLYETYGLPPVVAKTFASEIGIDVDLNAVSKLIDESREFARSQRKEAAGMKIQESIFDKAYEQTFVGYDKLKVDTEVLLCKENHAGEFAIILKDNPFYSEAGGQCSDTGKINDLDVIRVEKNKFENTVLFVNKAVSGTVTASVDVDFRNDVVRHHSSIHLLHKALNKVLNSDIKQSGSSLNNEKLRFDYNGKVLSESDLNKVEEEIKNYIDKKIATTTEVMSIEEAKKQGAVALFGDKYGKTVRVVTIDNTKELCGGVHIKNTSDIEDFAIVSNEQKSATIARINAICGKENIAKYFDEVAKKNNKDIVALSKKSKMFKDLGLDNNELETTLDIEALRKSKHAFKQIIPAINKAREIAKKMDKELKKKSEQITISKYTDLTSSIQKVKELNIAFIIDPIFNSKAMNQLQSLNKNISNLAIIAITKSDKASPFAISLSKEASQIVRAGDLAKMLTETCGGKGGGSPVFAQGAIFDSSKIEEAKTKIMENLNG